MHCSWESNPALAMHCRLHWFDHLQVQGILKADECPAYTPVEYGTLYLTMYTVHTTILTATFWIHCDKLTVSKKPPNFLRIHKAVAL